MKFHSRLFLVGAFAGAAMLSTPAAAQQIGNGTVTVAQLYAPSVNITTSPATYTATMGQTFEVLGTGAFTSATGLTGIQNGTINFSTTVGTTINQTVSNFFSFNDGAGGLFNFTPLSATTRTFNDTPGVSTSISLLLLGNTVNSVRNFTPTPTSLTLSFNSTGGSAFSSSSTLSIPPEMAAAVPETGTWAMMIIGFGAVGGTLRSRKKATVRFGGHSLA
ncbi:PEPxxWA-CTERM sorting domain-containing protein [uncultured Sphingomonas sp.]|uniref:PEPxxWA-CTERM sorting domain-containing protein n=1 Tax=uncultured Sphingomonas sp. TaxID=158754 RepID=UPI0035CB4906